MKKFFLKNFSSLFEYNNSGRGKKFFMGTNFYLLNGTHIGKRSAAGSYCWDCGITLCKGGNEAVHMGYRSSAHESGCKGDLACMCGWHKTCPKCGKNLIKEDFNTSSAGRELGFNKSKPKKKTGVATCSSFSWAINPEKFKISQVQYVRDEYKRKYTRKEFQDVLSECPIQYTNSIRVAFC